MENSKQIQCPKKTPEYYSKKDFMKFVGIKSRNIYNFLQNELTDDEILKLSLIQTFRKYLETYSEIKLKDSWTVEEEIENYRILGFTREASEQYVRRLKNIFTKDSTINWIFRIAESKSITDGNNLFEEYLKQFDEYNNNNNNSSNSNNNKTTTTSTSCSSTDLIHQMGKGYIIFSDPFGIPPSNKYSNFNDGHRNSNNGHEDYFCENDIQLVMGQARVPRHVAIKSLKKHNGDVISAVMDLTS